MEPQTVHSPYWSRFISGVRFGCFSAHRMWRLETDKHHKLFKPEKKMQISVFSVLWLSWWNMQSAVNSSFASCCRISEKLKASVKPKHKKKNHPPSGLIQIVLIFRVETNSQLTEKPSITTFVVSNKTLIPASQMWGFALFLYQHELYILGIFGPGIIG